MFADDIDGVSRPIADKIRRHFAQTAYRQPKVDTDSDSSSSDDLSESFEQILQARRVAAAAAAARQLQSQRTPKTQPSPATTSSRLDADTSAMNRLFVDCDLNARGASLCAADEDAEADSSSASVEETQIIDVPEPSMFEHLSPCKRVGLMRPSTVLEDSGEEQNESVQSEQSEAADIADAAVVADQADTSFETAFARAAATLPTDTSFETAAEYVVADSADSSTHSADFTRDSLSFSMHRPSDAAAAAADSLDTLRQQTAACFDDTLEVVEYDHTAPRYVLKPVRKSSHPLPAPSVAASPPPPSPQPDDGDSVIVLDSDSSPETSFHTARTTPSTVVLSLQKESRSVGRSSLFPPLTRSFYANESPDEMAANVIRVEQQKQQQQQQLANNSQEITLHSDSDSDDEADEAAAVPQPQHQATELDVRAFSDRSDPRIPHDSIDSAITASVGAPRVSEAEADSVLDESMSLDAAIPDEFNDTIERMDYLMELGRRIQLKQQAKPSPSPSPAPIARDSPRQTSVPPHSGSSSSNSSNTPLFRAVVQTTSHGAKNSPRPGAVQLYAGAATNSPAAVKKLFRTPNAKNSPILKAKPPINSPMASSSSSTAVFKKPLLSQTPSGGALKKTPLSAGQSRIPKAKSAGKPSSSSSSLAFDYVRSPIGAYISQRAPNPMLQNLACDKDFLDSTVCAGLAKGLDFTLPPQTKTRGAGADENVPPRSRLARKAYMPAEQKQIVDKRNQVIPGGASMQKLIGTTPLLVMHQGKYTAGTGGARREEPHYEADDSFNDMTLLAGDVSVQVVHNSQR